MGLLSQGKSLEWEEIVINAHIVKESGIDQLIQLYDGVKNRDLDRLKWGDEVEYMMVYLDNEKKEARLALIASEVLEKLQQPEKINEDNIDSMWRMEYADYMLEGTPGKPFCCRICRLKFVETSMFLRRQEALNVLKDYENVKLINYAAFPRVGCEGFTEPVIKIDNNKNANVSTKSLFYPERAIFNTHPRFINLSKNIRKRRGKKQQIYVPIYKDVNTPSPFFDHIPEELDIDGQGKAALKPDCIYMDCMGFGMGCSCLQITMQACNVDEARFLYDQLIPLAPIFMALSAASPMWKGLLGDYDCRWSVISDSVDDRTKEEYKIQKDGKPMIPKSRYDSVDMYLSPENDDFNDIRVEYDEYYYEKLLKANFDEQLAKHFSHLFIRDPISVFEEKLFPSAEFDTDNFENIQSTNWQSIRFKPPPANSQIGWRVEFRTIETQLNDFSNAAFVIFIMLLTRTMTNQILDVVIPISHVDENMARAKLRNAVHDQKFFFRSDISNRLDNNVVDVAEYSLDTIINGDKNFIGLIPIMKNYIKRIPLNEDTIWHINRSFDLIGGIASGKYMTTASWMRSFVTNHPSYKFDSVVSNEIIYDLTNKIDSISNKNDGCPELYGKHKNQDVDEKYISEYREMLICSSSVVDSIAGVPKINCISSHI